MSGNDELGWTRCHELVQGCVLPLEGASPPSFWWNVRSEPDLPLQTHNHVKWGFKS